MHSNPNAQVKTSWAVETKKDILRHTGTAVADAVKGFLQKGMALRGNTSKDEHCKQRVEPMMHTLSLNYNTCPRNMRSGQNKTNAVGS